MTQHFDKKRPKPPLRRHYLAFFLRFGTATLGGADREQLKPELVDRLGWIGEKRFQGVVAMTRVTLGLPLINLVVGVGRAIAGAPGAGLAVMALLVVPSLAAMAAAWLLDGFGFFQGSAVILTAQPFLQGISAAAAGLSFAAAASGFRRGNLSWRHGLMIAVMAGLTLFGHVPVILVPLLALPVSVAIVLLQRKPDDRDL